MKTKNILYATFLLVLAACSKGKNDFLYNPSVLPITVNGYNGGGSETLQVHIDTFPFVLSTGMFSMSHAYLFPAGKSSVQLTVTERSTGKTLLDSTLKKEDGRASIRFFYFDGRLGDMPVAPPVEEGKIKIVYMFQPGITHYSEPVDIVLGKFYFTPKVFEEITRIKNVKPYAFSEPAILSTFPTAGQVYNGQPTPVQFQVYVYKAGTNEPYAEGLGYTWNASNSSAPKPAPTTAISKIYVFSEAPSGTLMRFDKKLEL